MTSHEHKPTEATEKAYPVLLTEAPSARKSISENTFIDMTKIPKRCLKKAPWDFDLVYNDLVIISNHNKTQTRSEVQACLKFECAWRFDHVEIRKLKAKTQTCQGRVAYLRPVLGCQL